MFGCDGKNIKFRCYDHEMLFEESFCQRSLNDRRTNCSCLEIRCVYLNSYSAHDLVLLIS